MSSEEQPNGEVVSTPEMVRRWIARIALTVFSISFLGLLVLSTTAGWTPENGWVLMLDRALRISLFAVVAASAPPYVYRFGRQVLSVFGGKS